MTGKKKRFARLGREWRGVFGRGRWLEVAEEEPPPYPDEPPE
jgi:hypothetical protein